MFSKKQKTILSIFLANTFLSFLVLYISGGIQLTPDSTEYINGAKELAATFSYTGWRLPGTSVILAIFYGVFSEKYYLLTFVLFQFVMSCVTCFILWDKFFRSTNEKYLFLSILLLGYPLAQMNMAILSDSLAASFFLIGSVLLIRLQAKAGMIRFSPLCLMLFWSFEMRPFYLVAILIFCVILIWGDGFLLRQWQKVYMVIGILGFFFMGHILYHSIKEKELIIVSKHSSPPGDDKRGSVFQENVILSYGDPLYWRPEAPLALLTYSQLDGYFSFDNQLSYSEWFQLRAYYKEDDDKEYFKLMDTIHQRLLTTGHSKLKAKTVALFKFIYNWPLNLEKPNENKPMRFFVMLFYLYRCRWVFVLSFAIFLFYLLSFKIRQYRFEMMQVERVFIMFLFCAFYLFHAYYLGWAEMRYIAPTLYLSIGVLGELLSPKRTTSV